MEELIVLDSVSKFVHTTYVPKDGNPEFIFTAKVTGAVALCAVGYLIANFPDKHDTDTTWSHIGVLLVVLGVISSMIALCEYAPILLPETMYDTVASSFHTLSMKLYAAPKV